MCLHICAVFLNFQILKNFLRPEEDDVIELKKGIKSVQEKMNELALQKEAEKDSLQKQYNILQEKFSK